MANQRIIVTLPPVLRRVLDETAEHRECSVAEVVRAAIYDHLREVVQRDTKERE